MAYFRRGLTHLEVAVQALVSTHQRAEAGRVAVGHAVEVEHDVGLAALDQSGEAGGQAAGVRPVEITEDADHDRTTGTVDLDQRSLRATVQVRHAGRSVPAGSAVQTRTAFGIAQARPVATCRP